MKLGVSRKRAVVVACLLLPLAEACTSNGSRSQNPTAGLRRAVARTAGARSFELEIAGDSTEIRYQAPDRYRTVEHGTRTDAVGPGQVPSSTEPSTIINIYIGRTWYRAGPQASGQPETYTREQVSPDEPSPSDLLAFVRSLADARHVTRKGGAYEFNLSLSPTPGAPVTPARGEAKIVDGYLRSVTFQYEKAVRGVTLSFRNINQAPAVEPPAAGQVAS